jgi:hypothetical protein
VRPTAAAVSRTECSPLLLGVSAIDRRARAYQKRHRLVVPVGGGEHQRRAAEHVDGIEIRPRFDKHFEGLEPSVHGRKDERRHRVDFGRLVHQVRTHAAELAHDVEIVLPDRSSQLFAVCLDMVGLKRRFEHLHQGGFSLLEGLKLGPLGRSEICATAAQALHLSTQTLELRLRGFLRIGVDCSCLRRSRRWRSRASRQWWRLCRWCCCRRASRRCRVHRLSSWRVRERRSATATIRHLQRRSLRCRQLAPEERVLQAASSRADDRLHRCERATRWQV